MLRTDSSSAFMSVSSSATRVSCKSNNNFHSSRTPRLHIQRHDRLGRWLRLARLLLPVLLESLSLELLGLCILLLVIRAEQVYIVVVTICFLVLRFRVDWELGDFWTIGSVRFAWVAWERGELGLEGGDVLVPAVGVWELLDFWWGLDGLEAFDVGLRGCVAL